MQFEVSGGPAAQADFGAMPERTKKAMVRALNRGINAARTVMVSRISKDTGLRSKDVRDALRMTPATYDRPVARMATSLKRIPLIKFGARGPEPSRGKGRGVSYKLGGQGKQRVPNAFIATMPSGHRGVFVRAMGAHGPLQGSLARLAKSGGRCRFANWPGPRWATCSRGIDPRRRVSRRSSSIGTSRVS
jgi:hypothetical protein